MQFIFLFVLNVNFILKLISLESKIRNYILLFFCVGLLEVVAEYFYWKPIIILMKPLFPILLLLAYNAEFKKDNFLFTAILITSSITNLIFIWIDKFIILSVLIFSIHRILMIVFLVKVLKIKDFIPLVLATIPFFIFSVYIYIDVNFQNQIIQYFIFFQNCMISVLGGMALSQYVLKDSSKITWLMLSVFLFFCLHFLVFVELFYVKYLFVRPLAMFLNMNAFYAFYRFVVTIKKEDHLNLKN